MLLAIYCYYNHILMSMRHLSQLCLRSYLYGNRIDVIHGLLPQSMLKLMLKTNETVFILVIFYPKQIFQILGISSLQYFEDLKSRKEIFIFRSTLLGTQLVLNMLDMGGLLTSMLISHLDIKRYYGIVTEIWL